MNFNKIYPYTTEYMRNYFILFLFQLWITRAFLLYNTLFPIYRTLNNHIQGNLLPKLDANNESKLIISTPGGLYGFYFLGISSYVKRHQDLSKYIFSGIQSSTKSVCKYKLLYNTSFKSRFRSR